MKNKKFKSTVALGITGIVIVFSGIGILSDIAIVDKKCSNIDFSSYENSDNFLDPAKTVDNFHPICNWLAIESLSSSYGKKYYSEWFNSLSKSYFETNEDGSLKNLYANSEGLATFIYISCRGHFWNLPLHQRKIPVDTYVSNQFIYEKSIVHNQPEYAVRGSDYKYVDSAIDKAVSPINLIAYHGVEYMETEFYDQLKDNITQLPNGEYNYQNCIGKTITSYGWLSCTLRWSWAYNYSYGEDWTSNPVKYIPPLKEPAMFRIKIPTHSIGVSYVSNWEYVKNAQINREQSVMIARNKSYIIENWEKDNNGVNIFDIKLIN